jgi:hypothetical protein
VFYESGKAEVLADKPVLVPLCNAEDEGNAVGSDFVF